VYPPGIDAAAPERAMKQYDTDGDGKIAGEELDQAPSLKAAIGNLDTNGDGAVSADEISARIEAWKESKLGRMSLHCTVTYQGRPLEGAKVVFEPEKFLGDELQPATGTTDKNGVAMISVPTSGSDDPPGVAPGLYLVRITKEGMDIPARSNTETVLGQEAAQDAAGRVEGIRFDLQ
jgi:hypothetical protein